MKFLIIILLISSVAVGQKMDYNCEVMDKSVNLLVNQRHDELVKNMPLGMQSGIMNLATALECEITQEKYTIANMQDVKNPGSALQIAFFTIKQNIINLAIYSPEDNIAAEVIIELVNGRLTIKELNFTKPY